MTVSKYQGVEIYGFHPSSLADAVLLRETVLNARAEFEFWKGAEKASSTAAQMNGSFSPLYCDGNLAPLIGEVRSRAAGGSKECSDFLSAGETVIRSIQKTGFDPSNNQSYAASLTNYIYKALKDPAIQRYNGHHSQMMLQGVGAARPGAAPGSKGQIATLNATA